MHLKYGLSICPPVFAQLVEMCIFKIAPLLRRIIDLKVCVKFNASLFLDKQQKRWRCNVKYFFHNALRKGTEYKLNESFLLTVYVVYNRLLQVHAIQLTYNKCSNTFVVLLVYMCLIYMNIIITLSISVKCIFYQISKVFPRLSVKERD